MGLTKKSERSYSSKHKSQKRRKYHSKHVTKHYIKDDNIVQSIEDTYVFWSLENKAQPKQDSQYEEGFK